MISFGLTNALATYQAVVNDVLRLVIGKFAIVCLNDILKFSVLSIDGLCGDPRKTAVFADRPAPRDISQLRSFFGHGRYIRGSSFAIMPNVL